MIISASGHQKCRCWQKKQRSETHSSSDWCHVLHLNRGSQQQLNMHPKWQTSSSIPQLLKLNCNSQIWITVRSTKWAAFYKINNILISKGFVCLWVCFWFCSFLTEGKKLLWRIYDCFPFWEMDFFVASLTGICTGNYAALKRVSVSVWSFCLYIFQVNWQTTGFFKIKQVKNNLMRKKIQIIMI